MSLSYGGSKPQRVARSRPRQSVPVRGVRSVPVALAETVHMPDAACPDGCDMVHGTSARLSAGGGVQQDGIRNAGAVEFELAGRCVLFVTGTPADSVYEIINGSVMTSRELIDGRRQVLEVLQTGSWFGRPAGENYTYTAETLTACVLRRIDRREIAQSGSLQSRLNAQLESTLAALQDHALLLGRMTAMERVASFLLELYRSEPGRRVPHQPPARGIVVKTLLKQRDIGDYLGLKVETVSRKIAILKKRTIIATGKRGQFRLLDLEALQRMAACGVPPAMGTRAPG